MKKYMNETVLGCYNEKRERKKTQKGKRETIDYVLILLCVYEVGTLFVHSVKRNEQMNNLFLFTLKTLKGNVCVWQITSTFVFCSSFVGSRSLLFCLPKKKKQGRRNISMNIKDNTRAQSSGTLKLAWWECARPMPYSLWPIIMIQMLGYTLHEFLFSLWNQLCQFLRVANSVEWFCRRQFVLS